ncbi:hypothetical protein K435DRAFT_211255 [Dendrothele bispora CBS 962.96]|uniref:Uncharacterized protein n=1 Tax=Dendrothele bispora (strain CBS 962.96) TaxID=1314807 RepID=A0A4S8LS68_DENBC|nr:hypothetical protein K435DRAFT_211255 [Dendrothele bispora CBS 962.96]
MSSPCLIQVCKVDIPNIFTSRPLSTFAQQLKGRFDLDTTVSVRYTSIFARLFLNLFQAHLNKSEDYTIPTSFLTSLHPHPFVLLPKAGGIAVTT